ncbi:MAG: hypothetical protein GY760_00930 [Deltaproteobacteria bacterium]|nr:hypothetical protein [Deltaproteobacteria bacterium]
MTLHIKVDGDWKNSDEVFAKVNGEWKDVEQIYTKVNGEWKEILKGSFLFATGNYRPESSYIPSAFYTKNNGKSWIQATCPENDFYLDNTHAEGEGRLFISTNVNGQYNESLDKGQNWITKTIPSLVGLSGYSGIIRHFAYIGSTLYAVAADYKVYRSYSLGDTWDTGTATGASGTNHLRKLIATASGRLIVVGGGSGGSDFMAYSDNNGDSWYAKTMPQAAENSSIMDITYNASINLLAISGLYMTGSSSSRRGFVCWSSDQGGTWNSVSVPEIDWLLSIIITDDGQFLLAGSTGSDYIYKFNPSDSTKKIVYTNHTTETLRNPVKFPNGRVLYFSEGKGLVISDDNGESFYVNTSLDNFYRKQIAFVSS